MEYNGKWNTKELNDIIWRILRLMPKINPEWLKQYWKIAVADIQSTSNSKKYLKRGIKLPAWFRLNEESVN